MHYCIYLECFLSEMIKLKGVRLRKLQLLIYRYLYLDFVLRHLYFFGFVYTYYRKLLLFFTVIFIIQKSVHPIPVLCTEMDNNKKKHVFCLNYKRAIIIAILYKKKGLNKK